VGEAVGAAGETASATRSQQLHATSGPRGFVGERKGLRGDARGGLQRSEPARKAIPARRLGEALARGCGDGCVHDFPRSAPSRADLHAGASTWLSAAAQSRVWDVDVGEIVEGMRVPRSAIMDRRALGMVCVDQQREGPSQHRQKSSRYGRLPDSCRANL